MSGNLDPRDHDRRIAAELRAQIMAGEHRLGTRLPKIDDLAAQFEVSSKTIQRALTYLKDEELVEGRPPHGVFVVAPQPIRPVVMIDATWPDRPLNAGFPGVVDWRIVSNKRTTDVPTQVREVFGDEPVLLRDQLVYADGTPVEICRLYVPMALVDGSDLTGWPPKHPGSIRVRLGVMGWPTRRVVDRITLRPPTQEEYERLDLTADVPVTRVLRVVWSDFDRPVLVSVSINAGNRHELVYKVDTPTNPTAA